MESDILVSVVIPVKNGDNWLRQTIPAILNQQIKGEIEIIVVDSGSTDSTLSILSEFPVTVVSIPPGEFNHGLTRNLGAVKARGKYVVMTVQDAKPVSRHWLQYLLDGFVDEKVAAVCGQQIVAHDLDKNPVDWYRPISKPELKRVYFSSSLDFEKLSPDEKLSYCRWDDVNAMYRRDVLLQIPFRKTDFAEDALWAKDALTSGYAIVYNPVSQVEHYHFEDYRFAFQRNLIVRYHYYKYFGVLPSVGNDGVRRILSNIKTLLKEPRLSIKSKWNWLRHNYSTLKAVKESNALLLEAVKDPKKLEDLYRSSITSIPQAIKSKDFDK